MNDASFEILRKVTTATITTILLKKGIRRCWMNGPQPLVQSGERIVGPAFTLRFVPVREDLATPESWASPISTCGCLSRWTSFCQRETAGRVTSVHNFLRQTGGAHSNGHHAVRG